MLIIAYNNLLVYNGFNIHYYKNVFAHKKFIAKFPLQLHFQMRVRNEILRGSINECTYENGDFVVVESTGLLYIGIEHYSTA